MKMKFSVSKSAHFEVDLSDIAGLSPSSLTELLDVKARKALIEQTEISYWVAFGSERKISQESDKSPVVLIPERE